ncbi:MAG: hypothetical protein A2541_02020 [Candidatus Taylorbacteria bacterium RIFOXYD2_FULL_36_9]|uniref:Uncharacterized protein n=1 Tax=Candidatus Taylorbacteria bacterium RIFOXYD2_FULL_36_9 TaxID=1802338 RepID=A0A1G2PG59_9BACT|nr:MAG: hypothetical protein A2541_02020 [Candidatus Taylorbacteria bacterium RIFOXYD2_FULL_36_9]
MKKVFLIFLLSFILNVVWENLHSFFYVGYMGGTITEFILLRASVADAVIITIMSLPFIFVSNLKGKSWPIIFVGVLIAIFIELYALNTGRWAYNEYMPIIPILDVGLTPTIQLGLLGYLSYWFVVEKK